MCGIVGIWDLNANPASVDVLKRMTDLLTHRGPDGEGYFTEGPLGLGHRRLAIIDLSPAGHQPMTNDRGDIVITYNGEIYYFADSGKFVFASELKSVLAYPGVPRDLDNEALGDFFSLNYIPHPRTPFK